VAILELENLSKRFPGNLSAVDGLSLRVEHGELLVLLGPSGSGKTTTLRLVAGLERPTAGTIRIDGRPVDRLAPVRRDVAMVFQHSVLYPHLSVRGNLAFGLKLRRTARAEIKRRVVETAELLGIEHLLDRRPEELSGGEQQRVALGRAIVRRPRVFLLDEPLSHLDAPLRVRLREEIRSLHERLGITTLYVTHDPLEALALGRRIAVLRAGRLEQTGPGSQLYERPANRFVAEMLGWQGMNLIDGRIDRRAEQWVFVAPEVRADAKTLAAAGGAETVDPAGRGDSRALVVPLPEAWDAKFDTAGPRPATLGIRPEDIRLSGKAEAASRSAERALVRLAGRITSIEQLGADCQVRLLCGGVALNARVSGESPWRSGERVEIVLAADRLHLFDFACGASLLR